MEYQDTNSDIVTQLALLVKKMTPPGIDMGEVESVDEDQNVKIRLSDESYTYARPAYLTSAEGTVFSAQYDVGQQVLIAYLNGDPQQAHIIGTTWKRGDRVDLDEDAGIEYIDTRAFRFRTEAGADVDPVVREPVLPDLSEWCKAVEDALDALGNDLAAIQTATAAMVGAPPGVPTGVAVGSVPITNTSKRVSVKSKNLPNGLKNKQDYRAKNVEVE